MFRYVYDVFLIFLCAFMRQNVNDTRNKKNAKTHLYVLENYVCKFYKIPISKSICV